jgi:hypothetical protein
VKLLVLAGAWVRGWRCMSSSVRAFGCVESKSPWRSEVSLKISGSDSMIGGTHPTWQFVLWLSGPQVDGCGAVEGTSPWVGWSNLVMTRHGGLVA